MDSPVDTDEVKAPEAYEETPGSSGTSTPSSEGPSSGAPSLSLPSSEAPSSSASGTSTPLSSEAPSTSLSSAASQSAALRGAKGSLPAWLTQAFVQEALVGVAGAGAGAAGVSGGGGGVLRVTGFHAEDAVGKGDNYASLILRVCADVVEATKGGEGERATQRNLIVKTMPVSKMARSWVERSLLFPKEQRMYRETLPRMQQLLEKRLGGRPFARLAPRAIFNETAGVLVLEDLRDDGFSMAKRQTGIDMPHCLMVMKALGQFHALTVALHEEDPPSVDYEESFFNETTRKDFEIFLPRSFDSLAQRVETWPGFEHYGNKLREFGKKIYSVTMNIFAETEDKFKVLNHGDCWINNFLFKYSENWEPIDIRFVDFQISRFSSMVLDLQYFIFSSPCPNIRLDKMDEMLHMYHTTLGQVLTKLGYEHRLISWEDLHQEMKRTLPFGVAASCNLLAIVLAEPCDALDLENVTEEQVRKGEVDIFEKPLAGKTFANALRLLLPYYEYHGAI